MRTGLSDPLGGAGSLPRKLSALAINKVSALDWGRIPAPSRATMTSFTTIGFLQSGGTLTVSRLLEILDALQRDPAAGIVEVMLHPGHRDVESDRRYGHWRYRWENDLALLLDPALPEALARRGIQVTSFRELHGTVKVPSPGRSWGVDNAA